MSAYSQKFLRKRRFYTVLPLIVLPFVTIVFWLMGGGFDSTATVQKKGGLNMALPDAQTSSQSALDKLSFYAMADRDSVKRAEQMQMDPNYQALDTDTEPIKVTERKTVRMPKHLDERKTVKLPREMNELANTASAERKYAAPAEKKIAAESSPDIDRLQAMVQSINQRKTDPEIDALNGALDKLLALQDSPVVKKEGGSVPGVTMYSVRSSGVNTESSYFGSGSAKEGNGFLSDVKGREDSAGRGVIVAAVHGEQVLSDGAVIKLRLLQNVFVHGETIPAGSFVFGIAAINNQRMQVTVPSIQFQHHLYPVALRVYDLDGMEGIHIPGSAGREVLKQSADQGIQTVGGYSPDPSLKAQVASAGMNAAKGLLSRKVKAVRVTVKEGYQVLLRDENQNAQ